MNPLSMTPSEMVRFNARVCGGTRATVMIQVGDQAPEEFGDFAVQAIVMRIGNAQDRCTQHSQSRHRRRLWDHERSCNCALKFRNELILALNGITENSPTQKAA